MHGTHDSRDSDHDHSGHSHRVSRGGELEDVSDIRLLWAIILNQLLTVGQIAAGVFSGSVSLLSDAAHNFNDANALLIAYIARRVSGKEANKRYTFGYRRAEMIGALINLTLLAAIGLYLVYEGIMRFIEPNEIIGWVMAATAVLALVIDVGTAMLLWTMRRGSLNVRTAFTHNIVDALSSVAVLIGAGAIIWTQWYWVDPSLTLLIAGYVLWQAFKMMPHATRILMEGTPPDIDLDNLINSVEQIEQVGSIHHVHVWELDEQHRALEAHVVVMTDSMSTIENIKTTIKRRLSDDFEIQHSTLEFEYVDNENVLCTDSKVIVDH
ncbi:cation diffusion facilitator family transporter [Calycomorphotria hydatis]|uniref:Cadmium, cobalt and zinc/H(+)-K(+) antiporter n=1 Tax=Calycomorphotria hydatis TaxID=2528027 RepID=A0A517TE30_9PLAN|nr:cation diffusion facilitator family transporter [Calycomorphotria hydatis]QDT66631.1 Cadmium, cobalt and zinc/H(+)-K(+) antiporter [Calycomorphotria hydatis]